MIPPTLARWLIAIAARPDDRSYLLAEADVSFQGILTSSGPAAARRWYWRQALASLGPSLRSRFDRRPNARGARGPTGRAIQQAARVLRRHPWFALGVVSTLTLGVTAATTVFAVAEATLLRPLPYEEPSDLVALSSFDRARGLYDRDISGPDYFDIVEQTKTLVALSAYEISSAALAGERGAIRVDVAGVSPGLFDLLGIETLEGRGFAPLEAGPGAPLVVVLSQELANERYGDAAQAIGSTLVLDGESYLTIGVMSRRPPLSAMDVDAWTPLPYGRTSLRRQPGVLSVVARLGPSIELEQARSELERLAAQLEADNPDSNHSRGFAVTPLREALSEELRPTLTALTLAVALLLAIAIVNASGLILVRCLRRARELAIRAAIGASRSDLLSQLLLEGLFLGGIAAAASWGLASLIVGRLGELIPGSALPDYAGGTVWIAVGIAVPGALLATTIAAWSNKVGSSLLRGSARAGATRTRSWLLAGQLAGTTVLIVCVTLLGRSLSRLMQIEPGFDAQNLVSVSLALPEAAYPTDTDTYPDLPEIQSFYERLIREVDLLPGSPQAALAWHHPLKRGWLTRFVVEGDEHIPQGQREMVNLRAVDPGYFGVVGARLTSGRNIAQSDRTTTEPVIVVNRALETRLFAETGALGKRLLFYGGYWRVVGVVDDFKSHGLGMATRPAVFPPLEQMPSGAVHLLVRRAGPANALLEEVRDAVWRVDPDIAPNELVPLERVLADATVDRRFVLRLFGAFGVFAYVLAVTGIAGAVAEWVESRRRELGLRRALGADKAGLYRLVLGESVRLTGAGVVAGLLLGGVLARYLEPWLYQVSAWWPGAYAMAGVVLLVSGLGAAAGPAMRAMLADPRELLKDVDG